jgi:hypothetical protein
MYLIFLSAQGRRKDAFDWLAGDHFASPQFAAIFDSTTIDAFGLSFSIFWLFFFSIMEFSPFFSRRYGAV